MPTANAATTKPKEMMIDLKTVWSLDPPRFGKPAMIAPPLFS